MSRQLTNRLAEVEEKANPPERRVFFCRSPEEAARLEAEYTGQDVLIVERVIIRPQPQEGDR